MGMRTARQCNWMREKGLVVQVAVWREDVAKGWWLGRGCAKLQAKCRHLVPASRMAEHPKQWWTSKIRGKCAGKRPGKARELALAKPNIRTFSMANVFNAKVHESWYTLARFNVEKLNNENRYCIPLCMGPSKKRSATPPGKPSYWWFFPKADLHNVRAFAKNASLIAATLADAWQEFQEPGTILAIDWRVSREQEPCWRKPGKTRHNGGTDLAKAWNPAEPSGTRRSGGTQTQRNPAEPGRGTRRNPEAEPGGTWRKPGGNLAKKSKLKGGGWEYKLLVWSTPNHPPFNLLLFPPGSARFPSPSGSAGFRRVPPGFAGFW